MVRLFSVISPLTLAIAAIMMCVGCNEFENKHFESVDAARQEHMIEKGWIPSFIPADAKDIDFEGDLDAASVYGSYISGDTTLLRNHCANADDSFRVPGHGPKWFSDEVRESGTAGKLRLKGYETFQCDQDFGAVVLRSRKYVYYWSIRKQGS